MREITSKPNQAIQINSLTAGGWKGNATVFSFVPSFFTDSMAIVGISCLYLMSQGGGAQVADSLGEKKTIFMVPDSKRMFVYQDRCSGMRRY